MGHAPTPWSRRNAGTATGRSARHEIVVGKKVVARMAGLSEEDYANAEFIVRAVNSHEDLLAALEVISRNPRISAWFESYDPMALKQVSAAIGKAKKEEPWSK